jgi:GntR family transcriptional regulator / MocR family aminotransferase
LHGLDTDARVIYLGTFSKVLFPALRLGYVILPEDLVSAFTAAREEADICASTLTQAALTDFIREGHFARHLRRMRTLYAERRLALLAAIADRLGPDYDLLHAEAGMHLVLVLPDGMSDVVIARSAGDQGIAAQPLSGNYLGGRARSGLVLGYGGTDPQAIRDGVARLASVIRSARRRR